MGILILWCLGLFAKPDQERPIKDDKKPSSDLETDSSSDEEASTSNRKCSESSSADNFRTEAAEMSGSQPKYYDKWQPLTRELDSEFCSDEKHNLQRVEIKDTYVNSQDASKQGDENTVSSLEKLKLGESLPDQSITQEESDTLSADNLSVDARTCANPRLLKEAQKKREENAKTKTDDLEDKYKEDTKGKRDDIKDFINKLVRQQLPKSAELQFFDAAIVYDKSDYESVKDFKNTIEQIMLAEGEDDVRIELHDSEVFEQSKIMVVQDVVERCSIVFIYLTEHFNSPELMLFVEEATGLSRLELGMFDNASSSSKRWILKPVHTQPSRGRQYRTPTGLITLTGIDWFDRTSAHTKNQIVSVIKTAINERKQRSLSANTNRKYEEVVGKVQMQPPIGPPFNESVTQRQGKMNSSHMSFNPLMSHHSHDAFSLPFSQIRHSMQLQSGHMTFPGEYPHQQYVPRSLPTPGSVQMNLASNQYYPELQRQPSYPQTVLAPGMVLQTAGLDSQTNQSINANSYQAMPPHVSHLNGQMFPLQTNQQFGAPAQPQVPQNLRLSQNVPTYPPSSPQSRQNGFYQNQQMSRDALHSASGDYMLDQRHNTPDSSQLHVVSRVTGKLITNPNLSTDDVEIDNPSQELRDTCLEDPARIPSKKTRKFSGKHTKRYGFQDDTEKKTESEDSDDDFIFRRGKEKGETFTIVGCGVVQLGEGNTVVQHGRKKKSRDSVKTKKQYRDTDELAEKEADIKRHEKVSQSLHAEQRRKPETFAPNSDIVSVDQTSIRYDLQENLATSDAKKLAIEKNVSFYENEPDSIKRNFKEVRRAEKSDEQNQLDSVRPSKSSEDKRPSWTKMNVSLGESNDADGALSSVEDNKFVSASFDRISDEQLFESGTFRFLALESARRKLGETLTFLARRNDVNRQNMVTSVDSDDVD